MANFVTGKCIEVSELAVVVALDVPVTEIIIKIQASTAQTQELVSIESYNVH